MIALKINEVTHKKHLEDSQGMLSLTVADSEVTNFYYALIVKEHLTLLDTALILFT